MRTILIMLGMLVLIAVFAVPAYSQKLPYSVARGDTLYVFLDSGNPADKGELPPLNWPETFPQQVERVKAGLARFVVVTSTDTTVWHPNRVVKDRWRRHRLDMKDDGAEKSAREQSATAILREAGYKQETNIDWYPRRENHCYIKIWSYALPKPAPLPAEKDTAVVNNWYNTVQRIGGRLHLGIGGMTSPYNGALTLNLEAQFDSLSCLELAFGHSTGLLAQDRTVSDPFGTHERRTYDMVYSGQYVRYFRPKKDKGSYKDKEPWLGVHLGLIRIENVMQYNLKHIHMYQGITLGPSIRWKNLSASVSLVYGNEKNYNEKTRWEFKGFGNVIVYFWR